MSLFCPNEIVRRFSVEHTNRKNSFLSGKNLCMYVCMYVCFWFPFHGGIRSEPSCLLLKFTLKFNSPVTIAALLPESYHFLPYEDPWTLGTRAEK